ncbi:MAG: hypothetical protein V1799_06545 [bacterium]
MEKISLQSLIKNFDWHWLVVSYCLFVTLHLLPTFLTLSTQLSTAEFGMGGRVVWAALGVLCISCYVGLRSNGYTLLETACASVLYALTLSLLIGDLLFHYSVRNVLRHEIPFMLVLFLFSLFGAALGEWIQWKKQMKAATTAEGTAVR